MQSSVLQAIEGATLDLVTGTVLIAVMAVAVYTDLRASRIPNWLTLGGAALGLLLGLVSGGPGGGLTSALGWLAGTALFFLFFAIGVMGAGDVKLLAAAGALGGPGFALNAFVFTGLAGGIIALIVTLRRRRVGYLAANMTTQMQSLFYTGAIVRKDPKASPLRFPYGLAIAAGSVAALFWRL